MDDSLVRSVVFCYASYMPGKVFLSLLDHAQQQYGYLTPEDARGLDADPALLRQMAARGTIDHVAHGVYRVPSVPPTPLDAYMEAVLWTRRKGVLSHETALDLYELADVNPSAIHLTVPRAFRTHREIPRTYQLHRGHVQPNDVRWHEGLPVVTPELAIQGAINQALGWHLIDQAIETARARGLITADAAARLADRRGGGNDNGGASEEAPRQR
jgi:predicted transcriptional regulator of viral defense system